MFKKNILVDFDGVIHRYDKGWDKGKLGMPMPKAMEFLRDLCNCKDFKVMIYSSRSRDCDLRNDMIKWFEKNYPYGSEDGTLPFEFPTEKPAAWLTIDDRAICFKGVFPTIDDIRHFKPWRWQDA